LLLKYFRLKAAKEIIDEFVGNGLTLPPDCLTEYITSYCNKNFIPRIERSDFDKQVNKKLLKTIECKIK